VTVSFSPTAPGIVVGALQVGEASVAVVAEGLEVPQCVPDDVCAVAAFDPVSAQCTLTPLAEGSSCENSCLKGTCVAGTCRGALLGCDDADACTVDGCGPGGCTHAPRECPAPSGACQVATCDGALGCGVDDAPDGTLCGADDCANTEVDICVVGQCVRRPRPDQSRCSRRWVPSTVTPGSVVFDSGRQSLLQLGWEFWERKEGQWALRYPLNVPGVGGPLVDDSARQRVVAFGGLYNAGTWEWDGNNWVQWHPPVSPSPRSDFAMVYDAERRRVVLFGGRDGNGVALRDTWEWNGSRWQVRGPPVQPPARFGHAMAYDAVRKRVVLYGGTGPLGNPRTQFFEDTWEWDGATWAKAQPPSGPGQRTDHQLVYDAARQRVFLIGGRGLYVDPVTDWGEFVDHNDTWEWDGASWTRRSKRSVGEKPPDPAQWPAGVRYQFPSALYEPGTRRLLLVSGAKSWEWTGADWSPLAADPQPQLAVSAPVSYDAARQRLVVVDFESPAQTWAWNGVSWQAALGLSPPGGQGAAVAFDSARGRTVRFGGFRASQDTWEWDGLQWEKRPLAVAPQAREDCAMAYDAARGKVLLFGGRSISSGAELADTWEWDGAVWTARLPLQAPPARSRPAMAYDAVRQRVVLFGGRPPIVAGGLGDLGDTWEWDGTTWVQVVLAVAPPAQSRHSMAWDPDRKRVVLVGDMKTLWSYDGAAWVPTEPVDWPPFESTNSLAYDEARHQLLWLGETLYRYLP
jgi:hypothetical protein